MRDRAKNEIGSLQVQTLLSSFIGWMFDGYETSTLILVGSSAVSSLAGAIDPGHARMMVGAALGSTLLGWALGGVVGSIAADYIGRKKMLIIAIAGYCAFTATTAFSESVLMLIALRFLTGIFLGSEWSTGTALVAETWASRYRAQALGVMQSGYGFGFFLAAGLWLILQPILGPQAWRLMFVIGVLPALLLIYIRRQLPESRLWLKAVERDTLNHSSQVRSYRYRATPIEIFANPETRRRVIATLVMAAVTTSVFYGASALIGPFVGALAQKQNLDANRWAAIAALVYNAGAIFGYVTAGFLAASFGRKPYMAFTFSAGLLSGALLYVVPESLGLVLICIFILGCFTLGAFSWMPIYLPELFATKVRSTASGFVFNLARLIAFPAPMIAASLFSRLDGFQPTVLCLTALNVLGLLTLYFLPETKGKPLPA